MTDSLAAVDNAVSAAQAAASISIDPTAAPNLAAHLASLSQTLSQWPSSLRPLAVKALTGAVTTNTQMVQAWPRVDRTDQAALLSFAGALGQAASTSASSVSTLQAALSPFRSLTDQSVSDLQADAQALSDRVSADQTDIDALQAKIKGEYESNLATAYAEILEFGPGFVSQSDIDSMVKILADAQGSVGQMKADTDRLSQMLDQVKQLASGDGALQNVSALVAGIGSGLSDMQTAVAEVANALAQVIQQKPLPAILAPQLDGMVDDLTNADKISNEMLSAT
jgi:hypothetical protein